MKNGPRDGYKGPRRRNLFRTSYFPILGVTFAFVFRSRISSGRAPCMMTSFRPQYVWRFLLVSTSAMLSRPGVGCITESSPSSNESHMCKTVGRGM